MQHTAIYAGTFDPLTLGHVDLIERAARIFNRLILAVATRPRKTTMFTAEERVLMARDVVRGMGNVEVDAFDGLLVEYAKSRGVRVLVRGIRMFSDFEYEFQMALMNRELAHEVETVFLMTKDTHSFISSSMVREVIGYGGDIREFVPDAVRNFVQARFGKRRPHGTSRGRSTL